MGDAVGPFGAAQVEGVEEVLGAGRVGEEGVGHDDHEGPRARVGDVGGEGFEQVLAGVGGVDGDELDIGHGGAELGDELVTCRRQLADAQQQREAPAALQAAAQEAQGISCDFSGGVGCSLAGQSSGGKGLSH